MALFKIILALLVLLSLTLGGLFLFSKYNKKNQVVPISTSADEPPLLLKSIGVDLDYYDPNTGTAGEIRKSELSDSLNF